MVRTTPWHLFLTGTSNSLHDLVLVLWTCQIRQGMTLCRTLGREESECHASRYDTSVRS